MIKYSSLGGMAQLVEHSLHMRGVTGSSPVVSTKIKAHQSWWAFILVKTTYGREPENLFSAFGGCLKPLALCTVCIVADTLCRCAVYFYTSLCRAAPDVFCFDNRLELGRFYRPRAKLHVCDQGHTARDWPLVTIAVDESCCLHQQKRTPTWLCVFCLWRQPKSKNPKTCFQRSAVACNRLRYALCIS